VIKQRLRPVPLVATIKPVPRVPGHGRASVALAVPDDEDELNAYVKKVVNALPPLTDDSVTCFDRNFPGHDLITAIVNAGGHVVARVKAGISLPMEPGGWLPDGSRLTWLNAPSGKKEDRLAVRAAEHNAVLPCGDGEEAPETCTLITTLLDHRAAPAGAVREAYLTRWSASETTFGEDKSAIAGAGNRTSGPVLRSGSPRLVIQEAWAWLTAAQLVRASAQVTADEESFTAVRHHAVRAMTSSQVTATSSLEALTAAADAAARAALHTLNVPRRERHSQRARNSGTPPRPSRPSPGKPRSPYSRPAPGKPQPRRATARKEEPPRYPGPRTVEPRATPPRHAGRSHARPPSGNRLQDIHGTLMPQHPRQSQTPKVRGVGS
jgi:hypothetical protein